MERTIDLEVTLPARFDELLDLLAKQPERLLGAPDQDTSTPRHRATTSLEVEIGPGRAVRQQVVVDVGLLRVEPGSASLPIHIEAADHRQLFPTLEGEITAQATEVADTVLRLTGRYRPPLGAAGGLGDRMVGQRLAHASIDAFFTELSHRVMRELEATRPEWKPASAPWSPFEF